LPEPLHCVTAAPLVLLMGAQSRVVDTPEPTHWLTVAGFGVVEPVRVLTTLTEHRVLPPPTLIEPLHWETFVTSAVDVTTVGAPQSTWVLAAWTHTIVLTVELVAPVARLRLFATTTEHSTAPVPAPIPATELHWVTLLPSGAADAAGRGRAVVVTVARTTAAAMSRHRRSAAGTDE